MGKKNRKKYIIKLLIKTYIYSYIENEFIKKNKKNWLKSKNKKIGILIEGLLASPTNVIEKARIAKAVEEKTGFSSLVLVFSLSKRTNNVYKIYESFEINKILFWLRNYLNPFIGLFCLVKTIWFFFEIKTGEELLKLKYKKIEIGDLIYDSIIRKNLCTYTVNKINIIEHWRYIFRAYHECINYERLFKRYDIKNIVTSHKVYIEFGILCRFAQKYGATIFLKDGAQYKVYTPDMDIREHHLKISKEKFIEGINSNEIIKKSEEYLNTRFSGLDEQHDVTNAFKGKKIYTEEELYKFCKIDKKQKNVFILPHAFSDAPHCGQNLLHRDYYMWLVETMEEISKVKDINIFIKPHPSSYMYNEEGAVEKILKEKNIKNIKIVPKDFNTSSIKDIADYILTAQGTAGLEFSCFGIPAIVAGNGYYGGFGIAIESETKEEYNKKIKNILSIKRLTEEQKLKAKVVLYLSFKNIYHSKVLPKEQIKPGQDYEKEYLKKYKEIIENMKNGEKMKDDFYWKVYNDA